MGVTDANHIVTAKVHVHLVVASTDPPKPKYGHLGVHDTHFRGTDLSVDTFVVQQSHQPLEPFDGTYSVTLLSHGSVLTDASVDSRGRRAAGKQAKVRVANVATETVHRGPD